MSVYSGISLSKNTRLERTYSVKTWEKQYEQHDEIDTESHKTQIADEKDKYDKHEVLIECIHW
jgi:hypothetical protein